MGIQGMIQISTYSRGKLRGWTERRVERLD